MTAAFADTNIFVYACARDPAKSPVAEDIIKAVPVISAQAVNEFLNVARVKMGLDLPARHGVARDLLHGCFVVALDALVIEQAKRIKIRTASPVGMH